MEQDREETAVRQLLSENARLKQKVFELEERLRAGGTPEPKRNGETSVIKLIEHKDFQVQQLNARLEEKKEQLRSAVREIEIREERLSHWGSALRLLQELFEQEAFAMIGVNRDGKIILYNRAAPQVLGEKFKECLHRPIETVDFTSFDPETARKVRDVLAGRKPVESVVTVRDRRVVTCVLPLGGNSELTGAVVRIAVDSA